MAGIDYKIKAYLKANSKTWEEEQDNIIIQNDSDKKGTYLHTWSVDGLNKPTDEQLNSFESEATKLENNAKIDYKRQTEYLSWQDQLEMIYKDQKNGTSTYKDHCDKVRSDNPKE